MTDTPTEPAGPSTADLAAAAASFPNGELVTIVKPGVLVDPFSQQPTGDDWANATDTDYPNCAVGMGPSNESWLVGRDLTQVALTVYMPYRGVDVQSNYRAVVRGVTYDVYGDAFAWASPFDASAPGGTELALRVSEG